MDYRPKVRPETAKLLEESIGRTLSDINHSKILYDPPHRVMEIKTEIKINNRYLIKHKSFCIKEETTSNVKRHPSEWEEIIANETIGKELISKIYKQLKQLNTRINEQPNQEVYERPKQAFIQRRHADSE